MEIILAKYATSKRLHIIEILIFANLYLFFFHNNLESLGFDLDETWWIVNTSERFDKLINGDFSDKIWNESLESFEVRPIPGYLVAFSQRLAGITLDKLPSKKWDWTVDVESNVENGALPTNKTIYYSRLPIVIITALSMLMTMISIASIHSRFAGYCFFVISLNSFFLLHLRHAMSESPLLLFTILSITAAYMLLQAIKRKDTIKVFLYSGSIGIFSGLAGESKLNGLLCAVLAIIVSAIMLYKYRWELKNTKVKIFLISTLTIIFFTLFIFIYS